MKLSIDQKKDILNVLNSNAQRKKKKKDYNVDEKVIYVLNNNKNVDTNNDNDSEEYDEKLNVYIEDNKLNVEKKMISVIKM